LWIASIASAVRPIATSPNASALSEVTIRVGRCEAAVAADEDGYAWPLLAGALHDAPQDRDHAAHALRLAGLQHGSQQVTVLVVDQQRQINVLVVVRVERRELLLAMRRVVGRIQVEDESIGTLAVAVEVRLQDHPRKQVAALGAGLVLEPARRSRRDLDAPSGE